MISTITEKTPSDNFDHDSQTYVLRNGHELGVFYEKRGVFGNINNDGVFLGKKYRNWEEAVMIFARTKASILELCGATPEPRENEIPFDTSGK